MFKFEDMEMQQKNYQRNYEKKTIVLDVLGTLVIMVNSSEADLSDDRQFVEI